MGFEIGDEIYRVQVKTARLLRGGGALIVRTESNRTTSDGYVRRTYKPGEIDLLAAYCHELDRCYLLPAEFVIERRAVQLRLEPARNGQRAGVNLASDYEFEGAVAQLARAPVWHTGGRGFESPQLHSQSRSSDEESVAADEFRNRLGWYMERASRGERFFVTRRGRPYVRLSGAAPQLRLEASARKRPTPSIGIYAHRYEHAEVD
jgi:prevent-host-death family protein